MAGSKARQIITYGIGVVLLCFTLLEVVRRILTRGRSFFTKKDRTSPPDCLQDPALGTHHTVQLKNAKLHYVESGPTDGQLMIFIHGFPEFWYSWRNQILAFNDTYRVIAPDLRGYGGSSKPAGVAEYTVQQIRDDVKDLLEFLGAEKCIVVCHDWGGVICWSLASHYPHLVDKLIIMNSPHMMAIQKYVLRKWYRVFQTLYLFLVNIPHFPEWFCMRNDVEVLDFLYKEWPLGVCMVKLTDAHMDAYKHTFNTAADLTGPMNYIRASMQGFTKPEELGTKIMDIPILMLWGTKDGVLSWEMAELSRDYAEHYQLVPIHGASHWVQQDAPDIVNQHMKTFLNA